MVGNGTIGTSGDGGPATSAQLVGPNGVRPDTAGNLYISDHSSRIRKVTPGGVISTVAGTGTMGYGGDGGPASLGQLNLPAGIAVDTEGNLYIADESSHRIRKVSPSQSTESLSVPAVGAVAASTISNPDSVQAGYAVAGVNTGAAPYGTAVYSFTQNGIVVSEAAVPASPPTTWARIFVDYRPLSLTIPVIPTAPAPAVDINTGVAVVNRGSGTATISYTLRGSDGTTLTTGHGTLAAGSYYAKFINQLSDVAPDFSLPSVQFASLEISSTQPLSVVALRQTINQRSEAIFTTTPTADLNATAGNTQAYFPQFVDGGGYTTSLVLLNTSNAAETGTLQILDDSGNPLSVTPLDGAAGATFAYTISPGGFFRIQTDGSPAAAKVGWVKLTPDAGTSTPVGAGVFSLIQSGTLVTEAGVPASASTTHARIYVDMSGAHSTGLAIASTTTAGATVTLKAYGPDGTTAAGTGSLQLAGSGHSAGFAGQLVSGLPPGFTGVLDISSTSAFSALTLRSLWNDRCDFLLTTMPIADATRAAPSPIVFPQIVDGGGYVTQFILLSAGGAATTTVSLYNQSGAPLAIGK